MKLYLNIFWKIFFFQIILNINIISQVYLDSTKSVEKRVEDLLSHMTLEEKVGQMTQAGRSFFDKDSDIGYYYLGSLLSGGGSAPSNNTPFGWALMYDNYQAQALSTRLKIPLLYGIDAVHGHNNVKGSVIFPHNIGLGSTKNPELVKEAARITAIEVAATGIDWTFAPCIAVPLNERWGRTYEGFAETPELTQLMSAAAVSGFQGDSLSNPLSILACAKHFLGDGGTTGGDDQGNTEIDEQELREIHLPGYIAAIEQNVGSIMATYNSWNGNKVHGHKYLLTDLLKNELGFEGFIVSDWAAINQLPGDYKSDIEASINAGIDMVMVPDRFINFINLLKTLVNEGKVSEERINDAVRRILRIKFKLGLFEHPYSDWSLLNKVGSAEHREVARECVRQSMVLLKKKDDVLPLSKTGSKILVAGKAANNVGIQCGGWTISWQGMTGNITEGTTILEAIQNTAGSSTVTYSETGIVVNDVDIAVVVIGETPYAEGNGDRIDLHYSKEDVELVRRVKASGKPVVVLLLSGRPMIIDNIIPYSDVLIAAWLPGTEGQGVADVLFGDYQPSGKLTHSWPKNMEQIPINFGDENYDPLFPYGFGLTSVLNSEVGASLEFYSSILLGDSLSIEASFTKDIDESTISKNDFKVTVNGNKENLLSNIFEKNGDGKTIIISLNKMLKKDDLINLEYTQGNLKSIDGGSLNSFSSDQTYNILNEAATPVDIPAKIEAEDYINMSGVQTENTLDEGGGLNVGWIENGDWMEYSIAVPAEGEYHIHYRVASQSSGGQLSLLVNGENLSTVTIPVTGGWQNWQNVESSVGLSAGQKLVKLYADKGGFNINWFSFDSATDIENSENIINNYSLEQNYPNPFNPATKISFTISSVVKQHAVSLHIYDILGRKIATLVDRENISGYHEVEFNASNIPSGVYFYKLISGNFTAVKKMLLLK